MNLADIPDDVLLARGQYSTLTHERRERVKEITQLCAVILNAASKAQTEMQHDEPDWLEIDKMLGGATKNIERLNAKLADLRQIVEMRKSLKPTAWANGAEA